VLAGMVKTFLGPTFHDNLDLFDQHIKIAAQYSG